MKFIDIHDIKPGMMLAQDIIGKYDLIFLTRDTILTEEHIEKIQKMNIYYICVKEKEENIDEELSKRLKIIPDIKLRQPYMKSLSDFKKVYEEVGLGKKIEVEMIKNATLPLIEEVVEDNNILSRLRRLKVVDDYTYKHSINVCILATMIGKWLNYTQNDLDQLSIAAILHDIGKCRIDSRIINKPDKLSEEEFQIIQAHPTLGYEILAQERWNFDICCGVLQHHERMDGSGYPLKIKANKIHEFAKVIAIADIFDAMTAQRVYKQKQSPFKVAELIAKNRFGVLDPYISNQFLFQISKFYVGNIVQLNTGEIGEIVLVNKQMPTRPLVKINNKFIDLNKSLEYEIVEVLA
ncbi:HD-GYP domain-containing protein [Inediibacterium massiliense]|uniref:HD-GYP domain-containing protein n=1 Tax=Inediibacterium massiliense TaxID=1658111 RepID=UPI0006B5C1F5|nr:HD-GYP domain-containing protein [Inediibacterium massiliense]